ncbi:MAG TPA: hypothetical protein EYH30_01065 [Anaerolineales bacterium]|nr:hypothetical protein [Anaerolineae bacterium]HIQ00718.1 hypothetical protein [Anaerolineales bacterium]
MRIRQSLWLKIGLLAAIFVAYALRTTTLTLQSMWVDEVMALHFTEGSFAETVRTIIQPTHNGPLFYLLLFWWRQVVGDSDFAARFLSTFFGVLTLPLLFQWARKLLADRTAALSLWLFAFSPFTLWFAQEAKMYALHMLLAVASSLLLLEAFRKGGWYRWLLYASLVSTFLYSHLFGGLLVITQAAMALLLGWRRWKRLAAYVATMLSILLVHAPLVQIILRAVQRYQPRDIWRGFVPLGVIARDALGQYFYRLPVPDISWPAFLLAAGLILAGGLFLLLHRRADPVVVLLHAFMPVLIFYAISFRVPVYTAKYLSAVVPALFVLSAWGAEALARLWRPAGVLILALGMLMVNGVVRDLTDPLVQRGDWRYVADYIDAHEGENDVVVVSAYYNTRLLERYYRGESKVRGFAGDPYDPWPFYEQQAEQYDHLWLVLHQDQAMAPGNRLQEVAGIAFPVITGQFPNGGQITLIGYQMRYVYPALPPGVHSLDLCFGNGLCLVGYRFDATELTATERLSHPPSNWIHAVLYWRREPQIDPTPFRPLVRVVDDAFNVWGGNMDRRPDLFDRFPPDRWPVDGVVETHFDLNLNPAMLPGVYRLEISLAVEGDEGRRMEVVDPSPGQPGDRFLFEQIRITDG